MRYLSATELHSLSIDVEYNIPEESKIECLNMRRWSIDAELGPSPVSSLGVVSDLIVFFVSEPVGKGSVLSLSLGESLLDNQSLMSSLN